MVSPEVAKTIVGIIGNVIAFFLFASPIPTFIKIYKKKDVEEYQAHPYLATVLNCALWLIYGLPMINPGSILVITINATGLALALCFVSIFIYYSPPPRKVKIVIWLLMEMIFVAIVVICTLLLIHTHKQRATVVGILCVIFISVMYIAPLTIMTKVIKTKSVKYMPLSLSIANLLNGVVWVIYGLIEFDKFILIGNGLGAISGVVQLVLYACYYKTTPKDDKREEKDNSSSQLQLSGNDGQAERVLV